VRGQSKSNLIIHLEWYLQLDMISLRQEDKLEVVDHICSTAWHFDAPTYWDLTITYYITKK